MSAQTHVHPLQWFDVEDQSKFFSKLNRALVVSFLLHVVLFLVVAGLRLPHRGERPLASLEVSLVGMPTPVQRVETQRPVEQPKTPVPRRASPQPVKQPAPAPPVEQAPPSPPAKQATPIPVPVAPVPTPTPPAPVAAPARQSIAKDILRDLQLAPVPTPAPSAPVAAPARQSIAKDILRDLQMPSVPTPAPPAPVAAPARQSIAKDILRDLQLPPDAPKLGELTPAKTVGQPQPHTQAAKVKLPDLPIPDAVPDHVVKTPQQVSQTSLSEAQNRELEEELKKVKHFQPAAKLEIPKEVPPKAVPPQQEASVPVVKVAPQTMLKAFGTSGTNPFWARVEAIIKSHWEPPPIDASGSTYSVVVKFRFYRNGTVKDIGIGHSSGNEYFDIAGRRAVQKPGTFPPFPAEMTEAYQDVEMVFRVGEALG
ncbi:MAG: TonB family protein [Nitrospira sp.]|nr:TonB family protein [Nitrospira sp.]